ncbi:TetR/AcrR family transcriptional regulator [bacterium]|nr:TetR/AcrR family transcriptional regulator [bacterium]MDD5917691.1 TetR/AcrR family transcriptional regulator [bacterium]
MKREEKNALSRQRILDAAMREFSEKGYESASLNTVCQEYGISKGIIYHYFKDKDALYLLCAEKCFSAVTAYLQETAKQLSGTVEQRLQAYFDTRLRFFADNPLYLGIFADAAFNPPAALSAEIAECRREFDALNISVLTELLNSRPLREGLSVTAIVEDFRIYMDFFNLRFKASFGGKCPLETALKEHEERCHRQLDILLHGVLGEKDGKQ